MSISDSGVERLNQLVVALVDEQLDRVTCEGVLHALNLMTGSNDEKLANHANDLLSDRVNLDKLEPIILDPESVDLFKRIYFHGSGISNEDGASLKKWLETGTVNE